MGLAAQTDYMPLEIMTDRAKRSYSSTHPSLFGDITPSRLGVNADVPAKLVDCPECPA